MSHYPLMTHQRMPKDEYGAAKTFAIEKWQRPVLLGHSKFEFLHSLVSHWTLVISSQGDTTVAGRTLAARNAHESSLTSTSALHSSAHFANTCAGNQARGAADA